MDLGLSGKRAAVAAASQGLGLAVAEALAREGAAVAICGRTAATVDEAARRCGGVGIVQDVKDAAGGAAFVAAACDALGGVDILITNSGGPPAGDVAHTPVDAYLPAFELNALSAIAMCDAAYPAMCAQGWGRIVAITSIAVRQPIANLALSNTARAGLTGYLKTLAREIASQGVTVNSLQPGLHATQRLLALHDGDVHAAAAHVPAGVVGDPSDFGSVAAFLCSESARFITGAAIPVDGGAYGGLL
ncbi:MAG: SDR family oxidoreductase [Acidimicrobiia bacterium]